MTLSLISDRQVLVRPGTSNATEHSMNTVHYVNNTGADISLLFPFFADAYKTGSLHEDVADLFVITILKGYNPDGTDRMIIDAA